MNRDKEIRDYHKRHPDASITKMATALGINPLTVRRRLATLGITLPDGRHTLPDQGQNKEIRDYHRRHPEASVPEISRALGMDPLLVRRRLPALGITVPDGRSRPPPTPPPHFYRKYTYGPLSTFAYTQGMTEAKARSMLFASLNEAKDDLHPILPMPFRPAEIKILNYMTKHKFFDPPFSPSFPITVAERTGTAEMTCRRYLERIPGVQP